MVKTKKSISKLRRGDIIKISFDPIMGHEQKGYRSALVLSDTDFYRITGMAFCVPITSKQKNFLHEIEVDGKEIKGVLLVHGARMLDLHARDFSIIERCKSDVIKNIQTILLKIINE